MIRGFEFQKKLDPVTGAEMETLVLDFWPILIQGLNRFDVNISVRSKGRREWIERSVTRNDVRTRERGNSRMMECNKVRNRWPHCIIISIGT
jgi:hypothetical protein